MSKIIKSFGFGLVVSTGLWIGITPVVIAGQEPVEGTTPTSESSVGDTFAPTFTTPDNNAAPDANVEVDPASGNVSVPVQVQITLNNTAGTIMASLRSSSLTLTNTDGNPIGLDADTQPEVAAILTNSSSVIAPDQEIEGGKIEIATENQDTNNRDVTTVYTPIGVAKELATILASIKEGQPITVSTTNSVTQVATTSPQQVATRANTARARQTLSATITNIRGRTTVVTISGTPQAVQESLAVASALVIAGASDNTVQLGIAIAEASEISAELLLPLLTEIEGMFTGAAISELKLPLANNSALISEQLVASVSPLPVDTIVAQGETPQVNPTKLARAINAHNKIIMESEPEILTALANNPEFQTLSETLKHLRAVF